MLFIAKSYELTNNQCYIDGVLQSSTAACTGPIKVIVGIGLALLIPFLIITTLLFVFWVIMLIHSISTQDLKDRTIWIIALVTSFFLGLWAIAAIIYYFAAKRPYDKLKVESTVTKERTENGK